MTSDPKAVRRRFVRSVVAAMGGDPELIDTVGTTVVVDPRRGAESVACYQIGRHAFVPIGVGIADDPARRDEFQQLDRQDRTLADDDFRRCSHQLGARVVGGGVMKTRNESSPASVALPGGLHVFDWRRGDDMARIEALIAVCDADDLDAADLDLDQLDELAMGLLDHDGHVMAYASSRPYDDDPGFGDIAVITHPSARRGGWGRAAVRSLCETLLEPAGIEPLYRCEVENIGSDVLSARLGFSPALTLTAAVFDDAEA